MINFSLQTEQVEQLMTESPLFRVIVAKQLSNLQHSPSQARQTYYNESVLLDGLRNYVSGVFNTANKIAANKIAAIKYVRQWVVDNSAVLSPNTKETLNSLSGAKNFVESLLHY